MHHQAELPDLLAEARATILEALLDGPPLTLPEIPRSWPVTRPMVDFLVRELLASGLVAAVPGGRVPGVTSYALTIEGRAVASGRASAFLRFPPRSALARATA